jgi:hypothetical protein
VAVANVAKVELGEVAISTHFLVNIHHLLVNIHSTSLHKPEAMGVPSFFRWLAKKYERTLVRGCQLYSHKRLTLK